jgi:hypothetical protein
VDTINLLANIALPTSFGAPAVPLQPGQVVQALVLELLQSGAFRLQLPQAVLDVRSDVPLTPGSIVTLAVKGTGSAVRLDILEQINAPPAQAPKSGAPAPDIAATVQAVRRPIGEALIVGRTNLPLTAAAPSAGAASPATPAPDAPKSAKQLASLSPDAPASALDQAVRTAASRQAGLAPLFADVEQAAKTQMLPAPVRAVVAQLLGFRVPLDENLTAGDMKGALARSGVLLERRLAAAIKPAASPPTAPTPGASIRPVAQSVPADDLKATLLVLRQVLKTWAAEAPPQPTAALTKLEPMAALPASAAPPLSPEEAETVARSVASALLGKPAAVSASTAGASPPPPYRGAPLTPQPPALPGIADDAAPRATAERLVTETDAALSRQTLLQAASLPDPAGLDARRETGPRWTFEVPFATGQGTAILPFEIARDGRASAAEAQGSAWRARFSLDLEPMGPVHALVTLSGDRASVTLWAERVSTVSKLNNAAPLLGEALRAAELQPSELSFRVGSPRAAKPAAPGRFMDRAS